MKERIRKGLVYKSLGEHGMVVWTGYHRHPITGDMERACRLVWSDGQDDTVFYETVWEWLEPYGTMKPRGQQKGRNGIDYRFGLADASVKGSHWRSPAVALSLWRKHEDPKPKTDDLVRAWVKRFGRPETKAELLPAEAAA